MTEPQLHYRADYRIIDVRGGRREVEIPPSAVGITVTPTLDGLSTLIVAWLEPIDARQAAGEPRR